LRYDILLRARLFSIISGSIEAFDHAGNTCKRNFLIRRCELARGCQLSVRLCVIAARQQELDLAHSSMHQPEPHLRQANFNPQGSTLVKASNPRATRITFPARARKRQRERARRRRQKALEARNVGDDLHGRNAEVIKFPPRPAD
jgi:hypothetical protein